MTKTSIEEIKQKIESEGLDYTILCYYGKGIELRLSEQELAKYPKLAGLWEQAHDALTSIEEMLGI